MTVAELIAELLKLDPAAIVLFDGYQTGYTRIWQRKRTFA
jgi:hypothetical protein